MRSEKVYQLSALIDAKLEQLEQEKSVIQDSYKNVDQTTDYLKDQMKHEYQRLLDKKKQTIKEYEDKCEELSNLKQKNIQLQKQHKIDIETEKERIEIIQHKASKTQEEIDKVMV